MLRGRKNRPDPFPGPKMGRKRRLNQDLSVLCLIQGFVWVFYAFNRLIVLVLGILSQVSRLVSKMTRNVDGDINPTYSFIHSHVRHHINLSDYKLPSSSVEESNQRQDAQYYQQGGNDQNIHPAWSRFSLQHIDIQSGL